MSQELPDGMPSDPTVALNVIRQRIDAITQEYASGRLNAIQYQALYKHYMEKRTIIERLIERNPDSDAWQAAATPGNTFYLRDRYEARPNYYVVFRRGDTEPLIADGKIPKSAAQQLHRLLQVFWKMSEWRVGLARKAVGDGMWMLMVVGDHALTLVVYFLQPSTVQTNQLRDLHHDFERANQQALERGLPAERMVFPQRALLQSPPESGT